MMLTATEIAGFAGAGLSGAAYVPQISHLVRAHCSAGISRPAFEVWLLASVLTTTRAIAIHAGVFIALGAIQIVATALIMLYAARYKDRPCPTHLPGQPTVDESATPAEHGGALRVLPARHPHSHAATEFQLKYLKGTT
jgi:PQ loop repeat